MLGIHSVNFPIILAEFCIYLYISCIKYKFRLLPHLRPILPCFFVMRRASFLLPARLWGATAGLFLLLSSSAIAQSATEVIVGNTYEFTKPVVVMRYDLLHHRVDSVNASTSGSGGRTSKTAVSYLIPATYRFIVLDSRPEGTVIHFLRFTDPNPNAAIKTVASPRKSVPSSPSINNVLVTKPAPSNSPSNKGALLGDTTTNKNKALNAGRRDPTAAPASILDPSNPENEPLFFLVSSTDLSQKVARDYDLSFRHPEVAAGTVILPVKMRFAPFDFSRDFALGLTVGPRWRISHYQNHYLNALFAFNANIVTVDSLSTGGKAHRPADLGALGTALGLVFDFNGPQIGLSGGLAWLSHRDQVANNWRYQGRPWLSLGVGFTLFTRNGATPAAATPPTQPAPPTGPTKAN